MSNLKNERGIYPAIGKALFTDNEAFLKWYLEQDGHLWLYDNVNYNRLIHGRHNLINDIAPGYSRMYGKKIGLHSEVEVSAATVRKINDYINRIGGYYDVLLTEPEMTVIQFGNNRFIVPTQFLTIKLYPDYKNQTLAELNRTLLSGAQDDQQTQSEAMSSLNSLTMSDVSAEIDEQRKLVADAEAQIQAVKAEQERRIEEIRAEARAEMQKIERMKLGLQVKVEELKSKVFLLESVIHSIECYIGDAVDFIQLRKGADAPLDAPLVVHQKLRYLDEDLPILVSIYGFQFGDSELFEEALKNRADLVDYFCPSDKGLSFVRVSKTGTAFGQKEYGLLKEYDLFHGKTIGILLRNGENLYFAWTDEARILLPDGNVFYTPKVTQLDPDDTEGELNGVDYPSRRYTDEQIEAMTPEEQKELTDKDQIAYFQHQRGLEQRKIMAKVYIFSIIQGLLDNSDLVEIPEKVKLISHSFTGSKYLVFSNADGWLEDNRYGNFSDILERFSENHKEGDTILTTTSLSDGRYNQYSRSINYNRSIDGSSRTHDCSIGDGEIHRINLIKNYADGEHPSGYKKTAYFVSLAKSWSDADARSNFELETDEFVNLTFLNSEWLHYAILNKKIGSFVINDQYVSYAHAVRYLKLAYEHLKQRESEELEMIAEHISDLSEKFPVWMVMLSDWKEQFCVRKITPYQAKRFAKWLVREARGNERPVS